jgi:hypothetical protein
MAAGMLAPLLVATPPLASNERSVSATVLGYRRRKPQR